MERCSSVVETGPKLAHVGPTLADVAPKLVEYGPNLARVGPISVEVFRYEAQRSWRKRVRKSWNRKASLLTHTQRRSEEVPLTCYAGSGSAVAPFPQGKQGGASPEGSSALQKVARAPR